MNKNKKNDKQNHMQMTGRNKKQQIGLKFSKQTIAWPEGILKVYRM